MRDIYMGTFTKEAFSFSESTNQLSQIQKYGRRIHLSPARTSKHPAPVGSFFGPSSERNPMKSYKVIWEIDVEAEDPLQAARRARRAQAAGTEALVFACKERGKRPIYIDLMEAGDEV